MTDENGKPTLFWHPHAFAALWVPVLAIAIAMITVKHGPALPYRQGNVAPHGYTVSLALFILPAMALCAWFRWQRQLFPHQWQAFWVTAAIVVPTWCLLDVLLGDTFFKWPVPESTLGWFIPGYEFGSGWHQNIPIEELAFYFSGPLTILLAYIWASESWLQLYSANGPDYRARARTVRLLDVHWPAACAGMLMLVLVVIYKKVGPLDPADTHAGFPGYMVFLLTLVVLPTVLVSRAVRPFMNVPAFIFTTTALLFLCLLWEVTLALPYGWWDYRHDAMMGVYIHPWFNLPIEETVLWPCASWLNICVYESARVYFNANVPLRRLLFGTPASPTSV